MRAGKQVKGNGGKIFGLWTKQQVEALRAGFEAQVGQVVDELQKVTKQRDEARQIVRQVAQSLGTNSEALAQWLDLAEGRVQPPTEEPVDLKEPTADTASPKGEEPAP